MSTPSPPPHWPWTSFRAQNEYARLSPEDTPNPPGELNPYLPWWWRFSTATIIGAACIFLGAGLALQLFVVAWLWGQNVFGIVLVAELVAFNVVMFGFALRRR